jgi:hypothetical protein
MKLVRSRLVIDRPKRNKTRTVPLPDSVAFELAEHLLDELSEEGFAVRERPLDAAARSPWPNDSLIRFYDEAGADSDGPQTDQAGR